MIETFFLEFSTLLITMSVSPSVFLSRGGIFLLLAVVLIVLFESGKVLKYLIMKRIFSLPELGTKVSYKGLSKGSSRVLSTSGVRFKAGYGLNELIHGLDTMQLLDKFCSTMRNSSQNRLPLPNVLLFGKAGTGKTLSAIAMAQACGASYTIVSGSELQSLGSQAGSLFRSLLDDTRRKKEIRTIIIDDADLMITTRATQSINATDSVNEVASVHCCLYVLLEAIRQSNLGMSIIITTSLKRISSIDSALLDR
jgi:hypothetical protein